MAQASERRALVLGATGHIGQGVLRELLSRDYRVTAVTRQACPPSLEGMGVDVVVGDLGRPGLLPELVPGHDVVIDAAAPKPLGYFSPTRGASDPVGGARRRSLALVRAVERGGARLAHVSSFATLPRPPAVSRDAGVRWRHERNAYFIAKAEMERHLLDAGRRGLPIVVANPAAVFGPWETAPPEESVVARIVRVRLPFVMRHVVNVIDVRDVATAVVTAIEVGRFGERISMSAHDTTLDEVARRVAELAGVAPPVPVDARFAEGFGLWLEALWALGGRPAPDAVCAVPVIADAWPMGTSRDLLALGVEPRPLEETLRDSVLWQCGSTRNGRGALNEGAT
jgi:dihydroflavonol-4-reductase